MTSMDNKQKAWRKYYEKNKEELNRGRRGRARMAYEKTPDVFKDRAKKYRYALKYQTLSRYSKSGVPVCNICGFDDMRALCLDHINNDGNKDRVKIMGKNYAGSGSRFYVKLRQLGYPDGYQTLCANCNLIKEIKNKENAK
jgi:hypothetical protein